MAKSWNPCMGKPTFKWPKANILIHVLSQRYSHNFAITWLIHCG